jgi:hypothetical protein
VRGAGVGGMAGVDRATVLSSSSSSSMAIASSLDVPPVPCPVPLVVPLLGPDPDTRCRTRGGRGAPNTGVPALVGVVACAEDGPASSPDGTLGDCGGKFKASCTLIVLLISRISFSYLSALTKVNKDDWGQTILLLC